MNVSRRGFLKISGAVLAASGFGISLKPDIRPCPAAEDQVRQRNHNHLSLLFRGMQHHRIRARRQGHQHGGGSGQPHQQRLSVQQGRFDLPDGRQRKSSGQTALPRAFRHGMERSRVGMGAGEDCRKCQEKPGCKLQENQRQGRTRQPHGRYCLRRQRRDGS